MVFRAKVDGFFISVMFIVILILGVSLFFPLFVEDVSMLELLILILIFLFFTGFILWTSFSIKYIFDDDFLLIKGGPFRSRIPYEKITKVTRTNAIFTGHQVLSARDALEIFGSTSNVGVEH